MERVLQILGVIWSVAVFIAVAAFLSGDEWNNWKQVKERVLSSDNWLPAGILVSNDQLNHLKGNLEVESNKWDGEPQTIRTHTNVATCPEGWYIVGMRGIDTDTGRYCTSCISHVEFICRKL